MEAIKKFFKKAWDGIKSFAKKVWEALKKAYKAVVAFFKNVKWSDNVKPVIAYSVAGGLVAILALVLILIAVC